MSRLEGVRERLLIAALLPGARPYRYRVSTMQFDEDDGEGPGLYEGVEVSAEVLTLWEEGLNRCEAEGFDPLSLEGLTLRHQVARPGRSMPSALTRWAVEREQAAAAVEAETRAKVERLAAYGAHLEGRVDVGPDDYSAAFWGMDKQATLREVAAWSDEQDRWLRLLELPNGDYMEIRSGKAWTRWTVSPELVADHFRSQAIQGHRYAPALAKLLTELEEAGALRLAVYSWFGGTYNMPDKEGFRRTFAGGRAKSSGEQLVSLREHLEACAERHLEAKERLEQALALAVPGSVEAVVHSPAEMLHEAFVGILKEQGKPSSQRAIAGILGLPQPQYQRAVRSGVVKVATLRTWCDAWEAAELPSVTFVVGRRWWWAGRASWLPSSLASFAREN